MKKVNVQSTKWNASLLKSLYVQYLTWTQTSWKFSPFPCHLFVNCTYYYYYDRLNWIKCHFPSVLLRGRKMKWIFLIFYHLFRLIFFLFFFLCFFPEKVGSRESLRRKGKRQGEIGCTLNLYTIFVFSLHFQVKC